ncbi:hypothetical protein MKW94_017974 [Papaver nudicaule]|uniref:Leucine-rich repeat-containing N-terminal plant-type domain-containing protein n=1 Tax=Papaver nudicaule TaxID=74823 RepID=A0AA41RY86_PAPNU|nr:hypothetical protein [Papaver nudicaule]
MAKLCFWISIIATYLISAVLIHQACALTDPSDVAVLQDLYKSLNQPPQLVGWNLMGGADPCGESWEGISCSGSSVISIRLKGLELHGNLGGNLGNLLSLKHLDVSHNHIEGEIPSSLPPNVTHIDLSSNNFNQSTILLLEPMRYLEHLNLSRNSLSGTLGNVFSGFPNLKQMDLSSNSLTGDLPSSFENLKNLHELFLHRNWFTGPIDVLAHLPLHVLHIHLNFFSGVFPHQIDDIPDRRFHANNFYSPYLTRMGRDTLFTIDHQYIGRILAQGD